MSSLSGELRGLKWQAHVAGKRLAKRGFGRSGQLPIVFGSAMAKSGSHALSQFLEGLSNISDLVYTDMHPVRTRMPGTGARPVADVLRDLGRLHRGDIGWGYLPSQPVYLETLARPSWSVLFLSRDPRDKLVSEIHYALRMHPGHGFRAYLESLETMEQRISASISGVPGVIKGIGAIYQSYQGWLTHPNTMVVRFEDLMLQRMHTLTRILDELQSKNVRLAVDREAAHSILDTAMSPAKSPTFRSARPGGWRPEFTVRNVAEFKHATGDLLQIWGYEADDRWGLD